MDLKSTLLIIGGSACSFKLLNTIIRFLPRPELVRKKAWWWRNISMSLHGAWAVLCFYLQPQMVEDLIASHSLLSHRLVAVSTGYFIHDFLDVALNQSCKQSWELSCFNLAVTPCLCVGYAVMSLLVEINTVFLHIRQLLLLSGQRNRPGTESTAPRPSVIYRVISWLNLGTLLVFCDCTLAWMTRWLPAHDDCMPRYILIVGTAGLSLISIMNVVLFYRLLRADVLSNAHTRTTRGSRG